MLLEQQARLEIGEAELAGGREGAGRQGSCRLWLCACMLHMGHMCLRRTGPGPCPPPCAAVARPAAAWPPADGGAVVETLGLEAGQVTKQLDTSYLKELIKVISSFFDYGRLAARICNDAPAAMCLL